MIRKLFQCAVVLAAFLLVAACGGSDDDREPIITTYATGLTSPRGLAFGPDGQLYVAEAGSGGTLAPTGAADCPANINICGIARSRSQRAAALSWRPPGVCRGPRRMAVSTVQA